MSLSKAKLNTAQRKEIIQTPQRDNKYKYEYQGQEHQTELGLNWSSFKYRNYDYAIGRFMTVDPLAEKFPYNSTYAFSENRVIDKIELEGLEGVDFRFSLWMRSQGGIQKEAENYVVNKVKQVGYENEQKYHTLEFIIKNLTPVEDIYGVFAGKDFEGNEYNRGEAAFWAVLGVVPETKVFKAIKYSKNVKKLVKTTGYLEKGAKEIITITKSGSFKDAKIVMNDLINLGDDAKNYIGRKGPFKGKVAGKVSADGKSGYRIDWDDKLKAHINWWNGKVKGAIPFSGDLEQAKRIVDNVLKN